MKQYRGKSNHREAHPKIFIWSHTKRTEIEYFQEFKNHLKTPLLVIKKKICREPGILIMEIIEWKKREICEEDGDQVWCILDIDDFYKNNAKGLMQAIQAAYENNIKIAFTNECFELWILLHLRKQTSPVFRKGNEIVKAIRKAFKENKLGSFEKGQPVFKTLLPFQKEAIKNAKRLVPEKYEKINWEKAFGDDGNPSTSIHFLVEEINRLFPCGKK